MNKLESKRKKAEGASKPQQPPQDLIDRAAQPEQPIKGDGSSEAVELQEKMREAATKFVELSLDINNKFRYATIEPETMGQIMKVHDGLFARAFSQSIYCTPINVMIKIGDEWIKLTEESVADATTELHPDVIAGRIAAATQANLFLRSAKSYCSRHKKVSWVLPQRKGGLR